MKDQYYNAALSFAQAHGFKGDVLPKGDHSGWTCPMAQALGASYVWTLAYRAKGFAGEVPFPEAVSVFIRRFDDGHYPELEAH